MAVPEWQPVQCERFDTYLSPPASRKSSPGRRLNISVNTFRTSTPPPEAVYALDTRGEQHLHFQPRAVSESAVSRSGSVHQSESDDRMDKRGKGEKPGDSGDSKRRKHHDLHDETCNHCAQREKKCLPCRRGIGILQDCPCQTCNMLQIPCSFEVKRATNAKLPPFGSQDGIPAQLWDAGFQRPVLNMASQITPRRDLAIQPRPATGAPVIKDKTLPGLDTRCGSVSELCHRPGRTRIMSGSLLSNETTLRDQPLVSVGARTASNTLQDIVRNTAGSEPCSNLVRTSPVLDTLPSFFATSKQRRLFTSGNRGTPASSVDVVDSNTELLTQRKRAQEQPLSGPIPVPLHSADFLVGSSHIVGSPPVDLIDYSCDSDGEASFVATPRTDDPEELRVQEENPDWIRIKAELIKILLELYQESLGPTDGDTASRTGSEASSTPARPSGAKAQAAGHPSRSGPSRKRQRASDDGNADGEDDGENRARPLIRPKRTPKGDGRVLACPYCKRFPERYSELNTTEINYRHCSAVYVPEIYRLKQHLWRVHARPEYCCPTCWLAFDDQEALYEHLRDRNCTAIPCPWEEKMSSVQKNRIKRRQPGKNVAECWHNIWDILFPDVPHPNSIYAEHVSEHAHRAAALYDEQAPAVLSSYLDRIEGGLRGMLDSARPDFVAEVVEALRPIVIQGYDRTPRPSTPGSQLTQSPATSPFLQVPPHRNELRTPPSSGRNRNSISQAGRQRANLDQIALLDSRSGATGPEQVPQQSPVGGRGILPSPLSSDRANQAVDYVRNNFDDELEGLDPPRSPLGNQPYQELGSYFNNQASPGVLYCEIPRGMPTPQASQFRSNPARIANTHNVPHVMLPPPPTNYATEWTEQQIQDVHLTMNSLWNFDKDAEDAS